MYVPNKDVCTDGKPLPFHFVNSGYAAKLYFWIIIWLEKVACMHICHFVKSFYNCAPTWVGNNLNRTTLVFLKLQKKQMYE